MTTTTKAEHRRTQTGNNTAKKEVTDVEKKIHRVNRELRERYVDLVEQGQRPGANHRRLKYMRDQIGLEFIEANSAFAASMVTKATNSNHEAAMRSGIKEDLYQEALVTLWEHFLTWDPKKALFTTYAFLSILGDVGRARVRSDGEGSYGDHQARSQVLATVALLKEKLGRTPSITELASETRLTVDTIRRVLRPSQTSLDRPVHSDDSSSPTTLGEMLADSRQADPHQAPPANLEDLWLQRLKAATDNLEMTDTLIVLRRYGLDWWPVETLQQVGNWLGIGREPVRRAAAAAGEAFAAAGTPLPALD